MTNLQNALLTLRQYTRGRFDVYDLAGTQNSRTRAEILSALTGAKVPTSKSGVNALRRALYDAAGIPEIECENSRGKWFAQIADFITTDFLTPESEVR